MATNKPTNQHTNYISIRVTCPHDEWSKIVSCVLHDRAYIAYPHTGKGGTNPHYHCFVPSDNVDRDAECLRNRVKRAFGGGNKTFSVCKKSNGIEHAVQYGSREGTVPIVSDSNMQGVVDGSPAWVEPAVTGQTMLPLYEGEKKPRPDCDWQLTYANLVPTAIKHARQNGLTSDLKETVKHLIANTKWRPSFHMVKNGVPPHYYLDYEFRTGKRKEPDMDWMSVKF